MLILMMELKGDEKGRRKCRQAFFTELLSKSDKATDSTNFKKTSSRQL